MRRVVAPLALFGVAITGAALAYPGGTWHARATVGFSFWHNFWCDLLSTRALNGMDNRLGSGLSRLAFVAFAVALARFWPLAVAMAGASGPARAARRLGMLGAVGLLGVALVPAATSQIAHAVAVVGAAACSVAAALLLLPSLARRGERGATALGAAVALATVVCVAQYVYQGVTGDEAPWLPGMQKIITALLLAFMLQLSARSRREAPPPVALTAPPNGAAQ